MRHVLTLVAPPGALTHAHVAAARAAVGGGEPAWLAPSEAADIPCDGADIGAVRAALAGAPVDIALQPEAGRRKRLLVADMDATIVVGETLDEIAAAAGIGEQVAAITRRAMNGELDFAGALRTRVALLKGLPVGVLDRVWRRTRIMPGAAELVATMRAHGAVCALVSGGFTFFTGRVAEALGFQYHRGNELQHDTRLLLGTVAEPILGREAKLATLRELCAQGGFGPQDALAVGDGANDLDMIRAAGLGVAFRAKTVVAEAAQVRVDHADLRALLFFQGFRAADIPAQAAA
jgi:phosphoserine phosphatase